MIINYRIVFVNIYTHIHRVVDKVNNMCKYKIVNNVDNLLIACKIRENAVDNKLISDVNKNFLKFYFENRINGVKMKV